MQCGLLAGFKPSHFCACRDTGVSRHLQPLGLKQEPVGTRVLFCAQASSSGPCEAAGTEIVRRPLQPTGPNRDPTTLFALPFRHLLQSACIACMRRAMAGSTCKTKWSGLGWWTGRKKKGNGGRGGEPATRTQTSPRNAQGSRCSAADRFPIRAKIFHDPPPGLFLSRDDYLRSQLRAMTPEAIITGQAVFPC